MTVHERPVGASVEWFTPPELFDALGLRFDLDPASPYPPVPWVPAERFLSGNGDWLPWDGRVWLNPPYGPSAVTFVARMIDHGDGMMLLPARTETRAFQYAALAADSVCFLSERLHFIRNDGFQARSSFGSVLFAFGSDCHLALLRAGLGWTHVHPLAGTGFPRLNLPRIPERRRGVSYNRFTLPAGVAGEPATDGIVAAPAGVSGANVERAGPTKPGVGAPSVSNPHIPDALHSAVALSEPAEAGEP